MGNKIKRFIGLVAAATMVGSTVALAACNNKPNSLKEPLSYTSSNNAATSNGGFAVEKDGYVYFINGQASSTDSNVYGEVTKASLMRVDKLDLERGDYSKAQTVVPLLFVSGNMDSGIYIHGDYVYFATPTTDKDLNGNVMSGSLDFKRAKLDGTEVMSDYYFRTSSNSVQFRFVKGSDGVVYCMYVENSVLKSFNTETRTETVLVKGAASGFIFSEDQDNGTVYYTMNVPDMFIGTDNAGNESYTQIYRVSPTATVSVDSSKASYTAKDGSNYSNTYDFNEEFFKEKNQEAKDAKKDEPYDLADYTTYGYVNLGELVVDGIGSSQGTFAVPTEKTEQFHDMTDYNAVKNTADFTELSGYTYSLRSYENGGIYFTRSLVNSTENDENYVYYLADEATNAATWNTIAGNKQFDIVSKNVTNASTSAIYYIDETTSEHTYLYVSGEKLIRETASGAKVEIAKTGFSGRKLLYVVDNYLYTYNESEKTMFRIDYMGEAADYNAILGQEEYSDVQILKIEFNTAWYMPEFFGNVLLYNNAQTVNGTSYNYVNAVNLQGENGMMTVAELKAFNEKYEEVTDYINDLTGDKKLSSAVMTYFRTGSTEAVNAVYDEFGTDALSENDMKEFTAYAERKLSERKPTTSTQEPNNYENMFKDENNVYYGVQSYFVGTLGLISDEDKESMLEGWKATVYTESTTETEDEETMPWWGWVLIAVGGVAVIGGGVVLAIYLNQRSKKAMEERMRTSKPRKMIDTTDDKTIDVYADETAEVAEETEAVEAETVEEVEATEEVAEEAVEEPVAEAEEPAVEPVAEAAEPVVEAPVAPVEEASAAAEEAPVAEESDKNE